MPSRARGYAGKMNWGPLCRELALRRAVGAALVVVLALPAPVQAKEKVTVQARAEAVIVSQLSFFKVDDLVFGRIAAGNTAGTVVLSPSGVRTKTGGVLLAAGLPAQPAAFAGKGSFNQQVSISVNATSRTLTRVGGTETMTMDTFVIGSTPTAVLSTAPLAFRIANTSGIFQFPVGATLRVGARQAPGTYTGTFSLTLNYQ